MIVDLLGRTFVVRTLDDAVSLRSRLPLRHSVGDPAGELVDEHGGVAFGPRQSATSLVSRRSQLRDAHLDLAVIDQQIIDAERETAHLKREIERIRQPWSASSKQAKRSLSKLRPSQVKLQALAQQRASSGEATIVARSGGWVSAKASCRRSKQRSQRQITSCKKQTGG